MYLGEAAATIPSAPRDERGNPMDMTEPQAEDSVDMRLKAESILLEEFNYASVVAYQSKEDSANLHRDCVAQRGQLRRRAG